MTRLLVALLLCILPLRVDAAEDDLRLTIEIDTATDTPFLHEMVRIAIRGAYKLPVTLEQLEQPDLDGFGWMQLGEDRWYESTERGRRVVNVERMMALFPERVGTLTIAPFKHNLTLSKPTGERYVETVVSEPLTIEVQPPPVAEEDWFPLHRIGIDDDWSNAPQSLAAGESALRKITITIAGAQPELIPPMPEMTGAGAAILPHPEKRLTVLRARGPVTRIFWRWTIRPDQGTSGYVDPLELSYFDATAREQRTIRLSAQKVAFAGVTDPAEMQVAQPDAPTSTTTRRTAWSLPAGPFAALLALLAGAGLGVLLSRDALRGLALSPENGETRHRLRALTRTARAGSATNAREIAGRIVAADLASGVYSDAAPAQAALEAFDSVAYARDAGQPPDPRRFVRDFRRARRQAIRNARTIPFPAAPV